MEPTDICFPTRNDLELRPALLAADPPTQGYRLRSTLHIRTLVSDESLGTAQIQYITARRMLSLNEIVAQTRNRPRLRTRTLTGHVTSLPINPDLGYITPQVSDFPWSSDSIVKRYPCKIIHEAITRLLL